jgi:VCBS repeat-containing protein
VTITILGVNDMPSAAADGGIGYETDEDTPFTTANVLADDADMDASDVLSVGGVDTAGTLGVVTDNGDGTFTYDPNGQFEQLAVGDSAIGAFTYTVSDGNGGTDTGTVTIAVSGVNDAPVAADDGGAGFTTDEETPLTTDSVLTNDTDGDAGEAPFVAGIDTTGTLGLVTSNGDGTFEYDPNGQFDSPAAGESATDTFAYAVNDGHGGAAGATVTITVMGVAGGGGGDGGGCTATGGGAVPLALLLPLGTLLFRKRRRGTARV